MFSKIELVVNHRGSSCERAILAVYMEIAGRSEVFIQVCLRSSTKKNVGDVLVVKYRVSVRVININFYALKLKTVLRNYVDVSIAQHLVYET